MCAIVTTIYLVFNHPTVERGHCVGYVRQIKRTCHLIKGGEFKKNDFTPGKPEHRPLWHDRVGVWAWWLPALRRPKNTLATSPNTNQMANSSDDHLCNLTQYYFAPTPATQALTGMQMRMAFG